MLSLTWLALGRHALSWKMRAAALLVGFAAAADPLYDFGQSSLVKLGDDNFATDMTKDTKHVWVVEYYADWCGHCKNFAKGYEKAATNLKGIVKFGAVNADEARSVMQMAGVQSFPTIKLYEAETTRNPYTGKMMKTAIDYNGPRNARALVEFATSKLPSFVTPVTDKSATAFKANGTLPRALLFTSKSETAPMFKAISLKLQGRMLLGEAREKEAPELATEMGVASYPALLVLPGGEAAPVVYDGELKPEAVTLTLTLTLTLTRTLTLARKLALTLTVTVTVTLTLTLRWRASSRASPRRSPPRPARRPAARPRRARSWRWR